MSGSPKSNGPLTFSRLALRVLFVVGLLALLALPQLRSPQPAGVFRAVRNLIEGLAWWHWLVLLAVAAFVGWLATQEGRTASGLESSESPAARLPISEAVSPANGGNGLVSAPFQPRLPWLGVAGWIEIKDAGKECVVIDGRRVYDHTALLIAPSRLVGRPVSARRVLRQPAPLTDVSAPSTTADKLNLTMVVSAKYEVLDPIYTASLQAPLKELADLLVGAVRNFVPSETLENILANEGELNERMRERVSVSPSILGKYRIVEILKAMPTGDQRIIDIINQTRATIQKRALITQEGENRRLQAETDLEIQRRMKEQEDEFRARDHQRELEVIRLRDTGETQRQMLQMIGAIAAAGIDPTHAMTALGRIRSLYSGATALPAPAQPEPSVTLVELERRALGEVSAELGVRSFSVEAAAARPDCPASAWVALDGHNLLLECPAEYPVAAPIVRIQTGAQPPQRVTIPWIPGKRLADAVISAAAQLPLAVNT